MKLVTFCRDGGSARIGALTDGEAQIVDLAASADRHLGGAPEFLASMLALIESGDEGLEVARKAWEAAERSGGPAIDAGSVMLLSPVPRPPQIRDCLCFEQHLVQAYNVARKLRAAREPDPAAALKEFEAKGLFRIPEVWYSQPLYYKGNRFTVIGPDHDVAWPSYCEILDYELEYGIFIGKGGKDISREDAAAHIFGFTIFNDFSARDAQVLEMPGQLGPAKGKDFDTGNAIGPCVVTADAIDPYNLTMTVRVNGEERGRGNSGTIHWKFEDMIAHISQSETLYPGEFIGSGTVGGGCGLEIERYLAPGDVVELEVDGIGVLRNRVVRG
jgi:2-keto-4-pentenoate hydratase/2-oxohepta-3-ene-1,7-dioic acid hydratase in catechol pathway